MSSSKKKANGAKEKPTKYDITIKYTDKDMPFILEEMTHRSNKDINNNTGARLSKLINKEYENIATSEDILVSVNKTVVLKLSEEMISLAMENFPNNKNIQEYGQTIIESFDLSDFFMKEE